MIRRFRWLFTGGRYSGLLCKSAGVAISRYQMYLPIRPNTRPAPSFRESRTTLRSGKMPSGIQVKSFLLGHWKHAEVDVLYAGRIVNEVDPNHSHPQLFAASLDQ